MPAAATCIATSSAYGCAQPPCANPPRVSSSFAPGACMTPSNVMFSIAVILGIVSSLGCRHPPHERGERKSTPWCVFPPGYPRGMATTFTVLAEPARRRILDLLLEKPRPVGELTERLGLTQPGTSKHLRVLREAGLVQVRADAQRRVYELSPAPLAEVDAWLAPYRRLWNDSLDALERHLDAGDG